MTRKDFLVQIGVGAGAAAFLTCLGACSNQTAVPAAPGANFSLDLTSSANSALLTKGGFVYQSGVVVAYTTKGTYVALSQTCPHQGGIVQYDPSSDTFICPAHGSDFSDSGSVNNGPATSGLKSYAVTKSGSMLHVQG
jgi:cytochrome b6-f complex iron-sulfur subunit